MKKGGKVLQLLEVAQGDATHIKVELYYSMGGMNYFSGVSEKRGLYISVSPVKRTAIEGGKFFSESFLAFSGTKMLVKEMAKFSQKTLDTFQVDEQELKKLIEHVKAKNGITLKEDKKEGE